MLSLLFTVVAHAAARSPAPRQPAPPVVAAPAAPAPVAASGPVRVELQPVQGSVYEGFRYSATTSVDETLIVQAVLIDADQKSTVIARDTRKFQAYRAEVFTVQPPAPVKGPYRIEVFVHTPTNQTRAYRNDFGAVSP